MISVIQCYCNLGPDVSWVLKSQDLLAVQPRNFDIYSSQTQANKVWQHVTPNWCLMDLKQFFRSYACKNKKPLSQTLSVWYVSVHLVIFTEHAGKYTILWVFVYRSLPTKRNRMVFSCFVFFSVFFPATTPVSRKRNAWHFETHSAHSVFATWLQEVTVFTAMVDRLDTSNSNVWDTAPVHETRFIL